MSAPSIPGLLSLDPNADPTNLLSSLTMGTEVEVRARCSIPARQCLFTVMHMLGELQQWHAAAVVK